MCATCGCGNDHSHSHSHSHPHAVPLVRVRPQAKILRIEKDVLAKNDLLAARNREWLNSRHILALNLMSSPGAGKTTLLERTIGRVGGELNLSVIEGDQETPRDAERIRAAGASALQINTGTGCHLDAAMLADGLRQLDPRPHSLVVIENVGNLVCPALFDLGEAAKVIVISVTEGEDKPLKYPHMFRAGDVLVLNKIDLLPHVSFDMGLFLEYTRRINPGLKILPVSATRGDGLEPWCDWLRGAAQHRAELPD